MMRRNHGRRAGLAACAAAALLLTAACSSDEPDYADPVGPSASTDPGPGAAPPAPGGTGESGSSGAEEDGPAAGVDESPSASAEPEPEPEPEPDAPAGMPASAPATVTIDSLGVESEVMELGLQDNGVIEVPPYNLGSPAGWFVHSPTPGEVGPSVILGHRNGSEGGPGIFADLPEMTVGDTVEVTRADGSTASFTVYRTEQFYQQEFPTLDVYGNTAGPELRLITCDGLNPDTGVLEDNFIVYAALDA